MEKNKMNMRRTVRRRRAGAAVLAVLFFVVLFTAFALGGDSSRAADAIFIQYNGEDLDPGQTYEMTTSSMQLMMRTEGQAYDDDQYVVNWSIEDDEADGVIATVGPGSQKTIGIVRALSPGVVTVTVTVTDGYSGMTLASATCNIRVVFSIDTTVDDSIFKFVHPEDTSRSLVLYADSDPVDLGLSFGDAERTQWTSANDEVVRVDQRTGQVTPVGAGKTQVTATYTPLGSGGTTYTAYLDVYVMPQVSTTGAEGTFVKSLDVTLDSGGYLYTDTSFVNNLEVIRSKVVWVVKKDTGAGFSTVLADSLGKESDLISIEPTASRSNQLRITGTAGEYDLYFYAYDTYDPNTGEGTFEECTPTVVHLILKGNIEDKQITLHKGDSYNFAEAYGMTLEEFRRHFAVTVTTSNGGSIANYANYNDAAATLTAQSESVLTARIRVRSGSESYVRKLMGLGEEEELTTDFITTINIVEGFYLDRSNLILSVGQTYQLNAVLEGTYSGSVTWESSNTSFVTVDASTGLVTGRRVTTQDVTITATLDAGQGLYKTATCIVKVEAAVDNFKLSPGTDQTMLVGDHLTVVAEIRQTVSVAPLDWYSTDTSVFTVTKSEDGKSAVITAVGGGQATLMVVNTVNRDIYQTFNVTVEIAINQVSFSSPSMDIELYKSGYNLRNVVSYTPTNATNKNLTWNSSDTSVAQIDADGYMTLKSAGTTLVTVYPAYNPYNVMSQILINVIGTPDSMVIEPSAVTLNAGESQTLEVNFAPKNTAVNMTWTPREPDVVSVAYDEERLLATLTGKAPGSTVINIVTSNGLIANVSANVLQPSTGISVAPKSVTVRTGESVQLNATLTPANSTDTLNWSTLDGSVARVDAKGLVTGVKQGTTFVRVQAYNGKNAGPVEVVQITVQDGLTGVTLDSMMKSVQVGSSITLIPTFTPATAFDKSMVWTVADSSVAKVEADGTSNAKVTGVKEGVTLVTGTANDGKFVVSCMITVTPAPENDTKVTVSPKTKYVSVGKSFLVTATVTGTNKKSVTWKSSKKKVATVTKNGKVKAKKIGTAYIRATAKDGSGAFDRCKVRVVRKAKKLKLNKYSAKMLVGESMKLKATITPKNATIKSVKWASSDSKVATVSSTGRVIALAPGMIRITATTKDGSKKKATCILTVSEPIEATGLTVENSSLTLAKGRSAQSGIVPTPADATSGIRYYSDNTAVATVDSRGKIRTKAAGQATIYGETTNGKVGYVEVQVVDLNRKGIVMRQYDTEQLHVNDISTGVTWYSKNINIATVDSSGKVTGRRKGTTTIYAVVNGVKLGCRVKIKKIK